MSIHVSWLHTHVKKVFYTWIKACLLLLISGPAMAQGSTPEVVLDISDHRISITSSFAGTSLLLFGAVKSDLRDLDMIVVVRGPDEHVVARKKEPISGIWVNRDSLEFSDIPSFYSVLSTKPLETIISQRILRRHKIGLGYIDPRLHNPSRKFTEKEEILFREALIRDRRRAELYREQHGTISIVGDALFRSEIDFPSTVPTGAYLAEVYLVHNRRVVGAQTTPLFVNKIGIEREIFDFANTQPMWYGIFAVLGATLAGLGAAQLFRKA